MKIKTFTTILAIFTLSIQNEFIAQQLIEQQLISDVKDISSNLPFVLKNDQAISKGGNPYIQVPSKFTTYYDRATGYRAPAASNGQTIIHLTASSTAMSELGVHFEGVGSAQIDRLLVMYGFKFLNETTPRTYRAYLYAAGSDSLPFGTPRATTSFSISDINAPSTGNKLDTMFSTITFSPAATVGSSFVAAIEMDPVSLPTPRDQVIVMTNNCANGDGKLEGRMCAKGRLSSKWGSLQKTYKDVGINLPVINCDPMIIPLVVGEDGTLSANSDFGKIDGLVFNGHYPSPAVESIKINYTLEKYSSVVNLRVFDITGRTVYESNHIQEAVGKHSFDVNVSTLASGEYFYTLKSDNGSISSRFLVH